MRSVAILVAALASSAAAAAAPQQRWPLTVDGWGPVRIGMTQAQVAKALNRRLTGEAIDDENVCVEKEAKGLPAMHFMFEDRRLTRISIAAGSGITTPRGIGPGATAAQVRKAYGRALKAEPHTYDDKPAEYLTFWTLPDKRGIRFETDRKRKVYVIHAGTQSVQYIEGCA